MLGRLVNQVLGIIGWQLAKIDSTKIVVVDDIDRYVRWYGESAVARKAFYNVGAGKFRHPLWTNVDHSSEWYSAAQSDFLDHDLESCEPLSISDASAEIVHTSHTIEHISDMAARKLFSETKRVFRPGGVFRASAPNLRLNYEAWRRADRDYFYWVDETKASGWWRTNYSKPLADCSLDQIFLPHFAPYLCEANLVGGRKRLSDADINDLLARQSMEDAFNEIVGMIDLEVHRAHPGQHCNWWTVEKLTRMLHEVGFEKAYASAYGQSQSPALRDTRFFDNTHPKISLYVEAVA